MECSVEPDMEENFFARDPLAYDLIERISDSGGALPEELPEDAETGPPGPPSPPVPCTANGRRPQESNFAHCPTPQSFVRCGPHHRVELCVLSKADIEELYSIWRRYRDDLTWPWYEKKPHFSDRDFFTFRDIAQKVVDAMVEEYKQPMVIDQATISNSNHIGHPPHADNVQFDSVWWKGKRIRSEDEVIAAQEGAYVLWRPEKTSYRSYGATISLSDPDGYEGGEVQFFDKWGDKDPVVSYKCAEGCGVAFCGCQRNIHAVTGVKSGFRLVFLVWTRPPEVRVPENQQHVCYFRPGTGRGVWLSTADMLKCIGRKRKGRPPMQPWAPKDKDDETCHCAKCLEERKKLAWKDRGSEWAATPSSLQPTPTTSAGNSPRTNGSQVSESQSSSSSASKEQGRSRHCPHEPGMTRCLNHDRKELISVLSKGDMKQLYRIWERHQDNLTNPWYDKKPTFSDREFVSFRDISQKVVDAMAKAFGHPLVLDQATVSSTNHLGHPPHADNVQFDSVWWEGRQVRQRDELTAARNGAEVLWKSSKTNYRNYSATVSLTEPGEYGGGDLEFYNWWGENDPCQTFRNAKGSGVAFCGCHRNIHAVTGVKWGFRLVLLIWTRPLDVQVPEEQKSICYFRPGTGLSIWLTTADLEHYPLRRPKKQKWVPVVNVEEKECGNTEAPLSGRSKEEEMSDSEETAEGGSRPSGSASSETSP